MQTLLRDQPAALPVSCFAVEAEAEPGTLTRLLSLFAKRGLVPERVFAQKGFALAKDLTVDIQVAGLDRALTQQIAQSLRALPGVTAVLTSEKAAP